jgi:hypothetical protein
MKLLVVICLTDHKKVVTNILHKARVSVFSVSETTGIKDDHDLNLLDDWFGNKDGEYDSLMFFSFTNAEAAGQTMQLITQYNLEQPSGFPIRAFILSVEQSSYHHA